MNRRFVVFILFASLGCGADRVRPPPSGGLRRDGSVGDAARTSGDAAASSDAAPPSDGGPLPFDAANPGADAAGPRADAAPAPDSGAMPGPMGLEHFCIRYFECGGTTYTSVQDCMSQALGFWGSCAHRRAAMDAFSECMAGIPCTDYDPDAYDPRSTPCAPQWAALNQSPSC